ncbi:MAG TPA: hypothetical protein QGH10_13010, partial [Armatimonadota bacterium]|nr:hypothetical protein [Armatimonadota bacterium]
MCDLLEVAAEVAYGRPPSGDRRDNSHYWRRAIENHEQNGLARLADGLVYGARSVLELLATEDSTRVPELIESLEARPWRIFDRLALHALRLFPTHAGHLIAERLMDPDLFDDTDAWHEYALLLRDGFMLLSDDQRAALVERARHTYSADAVLEEGDDPETGRPYTTRKAEHIADYRALRRLAPARQHVPASLQARFVEVEAESGPVEHPEFRSYITSSSGWPTPVTADELREMTDAQIIEALRTPLARVSHRSPAPQGLARQLQTCVEKDPARFAELAADFVEMDPTYVRGLVLGLSDAVTNENHFPWEPVLSLCRWTLDQPRKLSNRTWPDGDQDHGWVQTWRWIGDLLCKALQKHDDGIPYSCRDAVIEVIGVLVRDPDPSPDEQGEDDGALSHAMDALNSVRGSALHALIHYALWLNGHMVRELELPEDATVGFARMPEVVTILDERLDKDESLAIRSVYGQWLPWLRLLDAEWTTANLPRILPPGEDEHPLWEVAWHTYIGWCRAYDEMLEFLEGEYRRALTRLDADAPESPGREHPDVRLAEHLHMFYLRGKLEIGESSGLLSEFYAAAAPWLRARALERMGWWMQDDDPPSQVAVGRAIDLWE